MKEKKKAVDAARPKLKRSISRTLLTVILPVVTIGILAIIVFLNQQASASMMELSKMDLKAETESNARELGTPFQMLTSKFGEYADTLENVPSSALRFFL